MMSFVYSSMETADLVCLLIDATQKFGHGDEFALEILKKTSTPIFLLINKVDIIKKDKILLIIDKYRELMDFREIIPISALRGANVDVLEEKIYDNLPEAEKIFKDEETSIQSQRFLISEIIREKLLSHVEKELPWATATYIDSIEDDEERPLDDKTTEKKKSRQIIRATIFVERESHRRIVIGRQGHMIKTIGTEARKELEKILGTRIYLDLWVKVKEKWRDKADVLDLIDGQ
jgi:GTP-binding protein Era